MAPPLGMSLRGLDDPVCDINEWAFHIDIGGE